MITFILTHSRPFPTYLGSKRRRNGYLLIFCIFFLFFLNFLLRDEKERNGTERYFLFYLIHILFQPIFTRNVAILVVFYILNFLAIFLKFYITRGVGTKRNDNILFCLFPILFQPILAWNEFVTVFFNFLNFFPIFL